LALLEPRFSSQERETLLALARVAMPRGRIFAAPDEDTIQRIEEYLIEAGGPSLAGVRAMVRAFAAACRVRHFRSFARLPRDRQLAFVRSQLGLRWPLRMGIRGLLTVLKMAHYNDEAKFEALGLRYQAEPAAVQRERFMDKVADAATLPSGETGIEADVVVVGSGAGGAVAAFELARQGLAVVLLEEGRYFTRADFTGRPVDMQRMMYRMRGLQAAIGNMNMFCPAGTTVGGTTTVNSGTCLRPPDERLERWQTEHGLVNLGPEAMAPYYDRVEALLPVEPARPEVLGGNARVIARGCEALGHDHGPLRRNAPDCDGQGFCALGCPTDAKRSTNISYVPMALKSNAYLYTGLRADRVLTEGERAVGVSGFAVDAPERRLTVRARATVLACGTYYTPLVLLRNGLCHRSGQVGRNLTIHPSSFVGALFDEEIDGWKAIPQGYAIQGFEAEDLAFEGGFMPLDMISVVFDLAGPTLTELMEAYRRFAFFGFMIAETSRGRVRPLRGYNPLISYSLNRADLRRMRRGFEILAEVYFAAGARRVVTSVFGHTLLESRADLQRFREARLKPSDIDSTGFHPLGTCRMGVSPLNSVVGPGLETWDVKNLYIADGSVVPTPLCANPQLTIMALATRAAEGIGKRLS